MLKRISQKYTNKSFWKKQIVLITGVNGFIGGNLVKLLISLGANVIGISNDRKKDKFLKYERLLKNIKYYKGDISDYNLVKKVVSENKISICFHLAAQVDVNIAKKILSARRSDKYLKNKIFLINNKLVGPPMIKRSKKILMYFNEK